MFDAWIHERAGHIEPEKQKEVLRRFIQGEIILALATGQVWIIPEKKKS
jgi:hypothetical protein